MHLVLIGVILNSFCTNQMVERMGSASCGSDLYTGNCSTRNSRVKHAWNVNLFPTHPGHVNPGFSSTQVQEWKVENWLWVISQQAMGNSRQIPEEHGATNFSSITPTTRSETVQFGFCLRTRCLCLGKKQSSAFFSGPPHTPIEFYLATSLLWNFIRFFHCLLGQVTVLHKYRVPRVSLEIIFRM